MAVSNGPSSKVIFLVFSGSHAVFHKGATLVRLFLAYSLMTFLSNKSFSCTYSTIVKRSVLGFLKSCSKEFDDPDMDKTLFISLVRPILEYGSPLWSPQYAVHSDIQSVK